MKIRKKDLILVFLLSIFFFFIGYIVQKISPKEFFLIFMTLLLIVFLLGQIEIYRRSHYYFINYVKSLLDEKLSNLYTQIEQIVAIYSVLKIKFPLPSMRNWAISPDCASILISLIYDKRPNLIVELGSGVSSLIIAYCLKNLGNGILLSLEHSESYANIISKYLERHDLKNHATVLFCPLKKVKIENNIWLWYDITSLKNNKFFINNPIDILFIDGPPDTVQKLARYPALPLLINNLANNAIIIMDDAKREDEKEIVRRWLEKYSYFDLEEINTEKGTFILYNRKKEKSNG